MKICGFIVFLKSEFDLRTTVVSGRSNLMCDFDLRSAFDSGRSNLNCDFDLRTAFDSGKSNLMCDFDLRSAFGTIKSERGGPGASKSLCTAVSDSITCHSPSNINSLHAVKSTACFFKMVTTL